MAYLDSVRWLISGDKARAQRHMRTARSAALSLLRQTADSGVMVAHRQITTDDGVKIDINVAGMEVTASLHAPKLVAGPETTMAYVVVAGPPEGIAIVDVDAQKVVRTITGINGIRSIVADPRGRFLYTVDTLRRVIKINLAATTAVGTTTDVPLIDLIISPDGTRLHARYWAEGSPGVDGTHGGVMTFLTDDLSLAAQNPDQLWSNRSYYGALHPTNTALLYCPVYGDGDGDGVPNTGHEGDINFVPEAMEVYDYHGGAALFGDTFLEFMVASSRGLKQFAITADGTRGYACSSRPTITPGGANAPTVVKYDTAGGTLTRMNDYLLGAELSGGIAVTRDGSRLYVANATDGHVRQFDVQDDQFTELPSFLCAPLSDIEGPGPRQMQEAPSGFRSKPDRRMFYLSTPGGVLTAFKRDAVEPNKTVVLPSTPLHFTLGRANRMVPEGAPA